MKLPWLRKLAVSLALACAWTQPALGSPLLGGSLALALHANDHGHSASLRSDGGHIDIVLSHGESDDHDSGLPGDGRTLSHSERDHIVHITAGDAATSASRRVAPGSLPALAISVALPAVQPPISISNPSLDARPRGVDLLKTVVLRL